ncbi:cilia- and flagella-associated protein 61-like isoform X2 [Cylas formicarius]|uniref:cilia- and flagella-associated protein 61-like isoform X2 n=1 Tax=Cylas formicarius TaxID=197179 RepID=UPI002958D86A|nr:cilia- and flagella-associated protein 61-like isoform X2 [Cylas formicarius]
MNEYYVLHFIAVQYFVNHDNKFKITVIQQSCTMVIVRSSRLNVKKAKAAPCHVKHSVIITNILMERESQTSCLSQERYTLLSPKNVKRVGIDQAKAIAHCITLQTEELFGEITSIEQLLYQCHLSLGIDDGEGNMVAFLCLHTYPHIPAIPPCEWERWLTNIYGIEDAHSENTLWVRLFAYQTKYEMFFMKAIAQYVFKTCRYLANILLVLPPIEVDVGCIEDVSVRVFPKDWDGSTKTQSLYRINRDRIMPLYKVRRAVEEDNDDLVPLIDKHSKRLVALYGEYYIAELLTRHKDSGRHIIVAEYRDSAVAVIILNDSVNYDRLNEEFELVPFNGFKKPSSEDHVEFGCPSQMDMMESVSDFADSADKELSHKVPKAVFSPDFEDKNDRKVDVSRTESDYSLLLTTDPFVFEEDQELDTQGVDEYTLTQKSEETQDTKVRDLSSQLTHVYPSEELSKNVAISRIVQRLPKFVGEPNAFCIEVAACHADHEFSIYQVLEAVFQCFPNKEYCIMSLPCSANVEPWMFPFVRVIRRPTSTYPYELYASHKNAILGRLEVCAAVRDRMTEIQTLLSSIPNHAVILSQVENCLECPSSPYECFLFLCERQVIGLAVLSEEHDVAYQDSFYNIRPWIRPKYYKNGSFGVIESIAASPIFHCGFEFFKRELHRLSYYQVLFYKHQKSSKETLPLPNDLHWLIPALPRQTPEYDYKRLSEEGYDVSNAIFPKDPYSLYLSSTASCSISRLPINTRIVVAGCSNTAYAFMESLIFKQTNTNYQVTFNNITLVCADGINPKIPKKAQEFFAVQKNFITSKYLDTIRLETYVNVVNGVLTEINRKDQYIVINDQAMLQYDLLFLMCGEEFQMPLKSYKLPFVETPNNVFLINGPLDGNRAVAELKKMRNHRTLEDTVIVYGHFLQSYVCLAGLLEYGVPGSCIVFVEPFPYRMAIDRKRRHNISIFNDSEIYHATIKFIRAQGVTVYPSYYFIDWTYCPKENRISAAKFESKHKMIEVKCQAAFFFYEKGVSRRIYQVVSKAGLVFDGRLVVDNDCKTNDERIYAAGTLTKYSRKYFASNMAHKFFNRVEIGRKLGRQIRNMLVPGHVRRSNSKKLGWNFHLDIRNRLVPKYEQPVMRYCRLPGGLYYLSVVKPGRRIPVEAASSQENYETVAIWINKVSSSYISVNMAESTP